MPRNGKFAFPVPGRKSQKKRETDVDARSIPSRPTTALEWPSRNEEPSSKAHRVLGTTEPMFRATSKQSLPPSPGFMSITVSEASFNSQTDDKSSSTVKDHNRFLSRPTVSRRASSNVIGRAYSENERRGSEHSTASRRLHAQTSSSTLHSHYDPKNSPLAVSQQTSNSAVRDMALRRGQPQVVTEYNNNGYAASPLSPVIMDEARKKEQRKSRPVRLDLSKLFPKPRGSESQSYATALLSPNKMVTSPSALSVISDYHFPRPMTREPTPNPRAPAKLKKSLPQTQPTPQSPGSPMRKVERDEYDNAKVNVRRPPKGVQHWFDALDEDSDEGPEQPSATIYAPKAIRPNAIPNAPALKLSPPRISAVGMFQDTSRSHSSPASRKDTFSHEDLIDVRMDSPSQFSVHSTKTRDSVLSKSNLHTSSVLSFSSSEDEDDGGGQTKSSRVAVRRSLVMNDDAGDIVIGQAQAFEVRPHRRTSAKSARSTSTNATIEVMYTPEPPFSSFHYSRHSNRSNSRQSNHARQPSIVMEEHDVVRPMTAVNRPLSPTAISVRSIHTSASEPRSRSGRSHKLMAVTEEEEALLELMRKKRADMGMKDLGSDFAAEDQERSQTAPPKADPRRYRTSGFLAEASPVRVAEAPKARSSSRASPLPLLLPPRGRPLKAHYDASIGSSQLRDNSTIDAWSDHHVSPADRVALPHHLPTPSEFSPLDIFPPSSPVLTASIATTDHASPLPSPVTPGLRTYEEDINVKVASSDTSNESAEVAFMDTDAIDAPPESAKSTTSSHDISAHRCRRSASSGANASFPAPPTNGLSDLTPVSETSSAPPSIVEHASPVPKLPHKNSKPTSAVSSLANGPPRSRQGSLTSLSSNGLEKRSLKHVSRQSSVTSMRPASRARTNSVSDDVLAAWNSLGGSY